MRHIPGELADRIEGGAAMLCHAWVVRRADGVVMGFTDHDRDLAVNDVTCRAASGWTAGAGEAAVGMASGSMAVGGGLDGEALSEADIVAGLYDGSQVELWRVDWDRPELKVRLWVGTIARVRREHVSDRYRPSDYLSGSFVADLEGPMAGLDRVVGRTYGRGCDAVFGDGRCRVDRAAFPRLDCDKRWATCVGTFANGINFQGFPGIPGEDFLTAYPAEGGRHDGGRR